MANIITNALLDLFDSSTNNINDKQKKQKIFFLSDDEEEDNSNNYQNYIKRNIIQIHLNNGKNLNELFQITKKYFFSK